MKTTRGAAVNHQRMSERRTADVTPLHDEDLRAVAGGRKAGKGQLEYFRVSMTDLLVSSYTPTGS